MDYLHIYDDGLILEYISTVSAGNILQFAAYTTDDNGNLIIYDECYELTRQEVKAINKQWYNDYLDMIE